MTFAISLLLGSALYKQSDWQGFAVNDIRRHPFICTGQQTPTSDMPTMKQLVGGETYWLGTMAYQVPGAHYQHYDDATMGSDGRMIFTTTSGAGLGKDGRLFWHYVAPPGTEIHSIQRIGQDRLLVMQNGTPAKALIFDSLNNKIVKEIVIPTTVKKPHDMFRHVRMTFKGTLLVPHLAENKVCEYDLNGKLLWSVAAPSPWHAERIWNGNTLIAGDWHHYAREVDKNGKIVWEFSQKDISVPLGNVHIATRLSNGNTLLAFWYPETDANQNWPGKVQILELARDKKPVWVVSSWQYHSLWDYIGPISTIQLLDQAVMDENVYTGP